MGHVGKHGTVLLQYYTCLFLIFCYIGAARALLHAPLCSFPPPVSALTVRLVMRPAVGYVLLYNQGYKATAPLVGTVRLQLQRPEPPFRLNSSALQYCGDGTYAPDGIAYPRLQCRFLVRVHAYKAGSCRPVRLVRVLWCHHSRVAGGVPLCAPQDQYERQCPRMLACDRRSISLSPLTVR